MRIISGKARGIRLKAVDDPLLRPTEDRVKESMFSTLGDLTGKVVVDLFAGTGALGLEALSRGAARVVFVEKEREHIVCMEENLRVVRKSIGEGCGETEILHCDVRSAHRRLQEMGLLVDVVVADPPYHVTERFPYCGAELLQDAEFAAWAKYPVLLCLEHGADARFAWEETPWQLLTGRTFGIRAISFAKRRETMEGEA